MVTERMFAEAQAVLAGGVSASMRLHPYLGRPLYVERGEGPYLYGIDGKRYIDFNMSNGAALLGHDHPAVKRAVLQGVELGIICAAETPFHERLAARAGRDHPGRRAGPLLQRRQRGDARRAAHRPPRHRPHQVPEVRRPLPRSESSPGSTGAPTRSTARARSCPPPAACPAAGAADVVMVPWNDVAAFERAIARHGDELAAVICEPIHYNAGCIPPEPGFLELLRARTAEHGIVLIFDEVLSGFRTHLGGVQAQYGVTPDLTTHAKALANGLPLAVRLRARGADAAPRADRPGRPQRHLLRPSAQRAGRAGDPRGAAATRRLSTGSTRPATPSTATCRRSSTGPGSRPACRGWAPASASTSARRSRCAPGRDALGHDHELNRRFAAGCLERGVYFHGYTRQGPPGHAGFSLAHTADDFAETLAVVETVAKGLGTGGS